MQVPRKEVALVPWFFERQSPPVANKTRSTTLPDLTPQTTQPS